LSSLAVEVQDKSILTKQPREVKPIVPSESTKVVSPRIPQTEQQPDEIDRKVEGLQQEKLANEYNEIDYFQGTFGNVLRGFDDFTGTGLGDVADDLARSFVTGIAQGNLAEASNKIIRSGNEFTEEDIQKIIEKAESAQKLGSSKEFQDYLKTYEAEGKTIWGAVKGLMENPTVFPEVLTSSIVSMAANKEAVLAGAGVLAAAFGTGAATGGTAGTFVVPGVGTAVGAGAAGLSAAVSAMPFAFGAASTVVETGSVFAQYLQEELGTDENGNPVKPTKENVRAILEDPAKYNKIKNDAIARGFTVGIIDAVGGKLATGVGAKILTRSARATGNVTKAGVVKSLAATSGIQSTAGATGEVLGQVIIGKPIDKGNAVLEFMSEMPGGLQSTLMASLKVPTYKINGGKVSAEQIDTTIATMTPEQLATSKIVIENDFEGRKEKLQDKVVTGAIANEIREAQPDLNDETVNAIVDLQKRLNKLEGNKTQVAKDIAAKLRTAIKDLQENQLPETATPVVETAPSLTEELAQSIAAQETKPTQQDAIQEQAAGQVPVQSGATVSQEVEQGVSQTEPQVTPQEGQVQEEVIDIESKRRNKDNEIENISFNKEKTTVNDEGISQLVFEGSFLNDYDLIAQGSESTVYQSKDKSHVIKLSEPYSSKDPNVYEKRVKIGLLKDILGNSGIEVVGYYNYNGTKNPIFRQNYVEGQPLTENEAENYLRENNKVVEIDNKFYTKYNDVLYRVSDFENNLIRDNNGNVVPIDLNISEVKDNNIISRYDTEVSSKTQVNIAPYFNTKIETVEEAETLRQNDNYKSYKQKLAELATQLGIPNAVIDDVIGGYKNDAGEDFVEISNLVTLEGATLDQAEEFAALAATVSPQVQEASIAAQYTEEGTETHNANEYQVQVSDIDSAMKALKKAGISNFSVNEKTKTVSFIDILDFADVELQDKIGTFTKLLDENNISYEQSEYRPVESRYIDKGKRQEVLRRIKSKGPQVGQGGQSVYQEIDQAIARDAEFQGITPNSYLGIEAETAVAKKRKATKKADKETSVEAEQVINSKESKPSPEALEKALNLFDNLDKILDNKLKRNANDALLAIPLTTLQAAVKAVKVLIKGGIAVRDAIRRVAAENKIDENRLREAFVALTKPTDSIEDTYEKYHVAPESGHTKIDVTGSESIKKGETFGTVTYSNKEEGDVVLDSFSINDIDKLSNRSSGFITTARNLAQGFISIKPSPKNITQKLFGKGKNYEKLSDENKTKVDKERIKQTTRFKLPWSENKALASLNAYINKNKDSKPSNYYDVVKKKSKAIINSFKEEVKNNLRALYNNVSEEFREVSRQWYNGANRLAQGISESYGISFEQSAGILAALSPKNNWFNNISAAERVIRAWSDHQDTPVTQEMVDRTIAYMERNGEAPFAKDIRTAFAKTKGRSISELTKEYKKTGEPKMVEAIGITMRIIDQSEYSPVVYSVSPEGFIDGKYGVIGWPGGAALSNAVSMLIDPSMKNISSRLGNGNKVRNFYGNIIDPQNSEFLTADTHAFAAGLMLPASANEAQDFGLFKGGMSVEYAIFKDAYIEVAKEFGILPRELQSITWEAARGSINIDNRTPSMVKDINRISEEFLTNGESNENRTNEILRKYPIKFSKGEWSNKRGIVAQATVLGGDESLRQTADTGGSTTVLGDLRGADTQVGERAAGRISFDEVADLDVKSKDNLAVVADFLDSIDRNISKRLKTNANDALLAIPLTVVQGIVKGLKVLVQGGMSVRDALKKIAADNNISQEKIKDLLSLIPIVEEFNTLMKKADDLIANQKSKNIPEKRIVSNLDTMVRKFYEKLDINDAQRKIMEREARARMGVEPRKAASIGRVLGVLKDITNVTREEKLKIISRIRELGKDVGKELAKEIRGMDKKGKITANQAASIVARTLKINPLNEASVSNFVDYMAKVFDNANYAADMTKLRELQKQAKRKKHTSMKNLVDRFTSINPELIPLDRIQEYKKALDFLNNLTPFYGNMNEMLADIESYKEVNEFDAVKTKEALQEKYKSIKLNEVKNVEEYRNLIKDINSFKRKAAQLLENGDINQEKYDEFIELVGADQAKVEENYKDEITKIKKDLIAEIKNQRPKVSIDFSKEENDLIRRYLELSDADLQSLSPEELFILNDLLENISNGEMDVSRFSPIVSKAYTSSGLDPLAKQINKSKFDKSSEEGRQELSEQESSFWQGLLGMGRVKAGALQKLIISPFNRGIGAYENFNKKGYSKFLNLKNKYKIDSFDPLNNSKDMHKIGMLTIYLQEYMAQFDSKNKDVKDIGNRDWFKEILNNRAMRDNYSSGKPSLLKLIKVGKSELKIIKEIWDNLPKDSNENVDPKAVYNSYMANDGKFFTKKQKAFFDDVMEYKESEITPKQKFANELSGTSFKEILFHIMRVRLDKGKSQIAPTASSENNNVRITAGTGKERVSEKVGAVMTNFEELFILGMEQTSRDYFLSNALQDINNTLAGVKKIVGDNKIELINTISGTLSDALKFEFDRTKSNFIFRNLLSARAAQTLLRPTRTVVELVASLVSYPTRAKTLSGYKSLFGEQGAMKKLLEFTDSPILLRDNISKAIDINDGSIEPQGPFTKATNYLSGLPERTMMVTSWMPTFKSEFKDITGVDFDMKRFNDSEAYKEKYGKAIRESSAVADAQTEKIIGPTVKAGQRREIRIAPGFLANLVRAEGTVSKNTAEGQILGFFNNYPFREVTEFLNGFREAAEVLNDEGALSSLSQLQKPLGIALNVAAYGFLSSVTYALGLILFGDDDDEERGEDLLKALMTGKGLLEELKSNAISLAGSRYAAGGKALIQLAATILIESTDDEEQKAKIKKLLKDSVFIDPLPVDKAIGFKGEEEVAGAIGKFIPPFIVAYARYADFIGTLNEFEEIYDKVKSKGVDALTEDEGLKVLALNTVFNITQLVLNVRGTSLPEYNYIKTYMKKLKEEAGVADVYKGEAPTKKKSSGGSGSGGSSRGKGMNKTDMKKYNRELYNQTYGPGSATYETEQQVKKIEKEQRDLKKKMKDELLGGKN